MSVFAAAPVSLARRVGHYAIALVALLAAGIGGVVVFGSTEVAYSLDAGTLRVDASLALLDESRSATVQSAEAMDVSGGQRLRGTGRPDYCSGYWRYAETGEVWQATRCGRALVIVETSDGRWAIEPADRDAFLTTWNSGGAAHFEAPPAHRVWPTWQMVVMAGLFIVIFVFVAASLLRATLHYRVEGARLLVPGILGSHDVPLAGARVWRDQRGSRRWLRVFGAGTPALHLGIYRGEGRWLRVCASRLDDVVFVQTEDHTFVLSPAESDKFQRALLEQGASAGDPR